MSVSFSSPEAVTMSMISTPRYDPFVAQYSPYPNAVLPSDPVVMQPQPQAEFHNDWMTIPYGIPDCSRGLEYISTLNQLLIQQKYHLAEAIIGYEENNKYIIKNCLGQNVYLAAEDNDCCTRNCCGSYRPFNMKVLDLYNNEIIQFYRPLACSGCCFPCCLQTIEVSSPPGQVIGRVDEEWTCWYPNYKIKNQNGETVLRIEGPCCTSSCCSDINFKIVDLGGTEIGRISKKWSGLAREFFTDADFFGINFPMDLDVRMKAVLIGACMLIVILIIARLLCCHIHI